MSRFTAGIVVIVVLLSGCGSSDATGSDTAELLHGTWHDITPGHDIYLTFNEQGRWGVHMTSEVESDPYGWGTYALDGAEITMTDHPDSPICGGAIAVWTIAYSETGDEAFFTFVEDSCTASPRSEDWTLIRQTP